MEDDAKEVVKAGLEIVLRPVTEIAENVLGRLGGDWLSENRARNRARLKAETDEILRRRKVENAQEPPPSIVVPLLTHAQDEGREALVSLWAKLLAAAMDPALAGNYRREFVEIVQQLEPLDVLVLPQLAHADLSPSRREYLAKHLSVSADQVELSFRNLNRLEVTFQMAGGNPKIYPILTTLGRELLVLVK